MPSGHIAKKRNSGNSVTPSGGFRLTGCVPQTSQAGCQTIVYTSRITIKPTHAYEPHNNREIILDITGNLVQIGKWTLKGFSRQRQNIELYLRLTRRNVDELTKRDLGSPIRRPFDAFRSEFDSLERQYADGIADHRIWANSITGIAVTLSRDTV